MTFHNFERKKWGMYDLLDQESDWNYLAQPSPPPPPPSDEI
jgi:hypothetical protein